MALIEWDPVHKHFSYVLPERRKKPKERSRKMRARLAERDGVACYLCERSDIPLRRLRIEHRVPRSRGGSNSLDNLALSCLDCDIAKGNMTEDEYREKM